jgi:hypothetical protein
MSASEAWRKSVEALGRKASRYGTGVCSQLDALIYLDLKGQHLWPLEDASDGKSIEQAAAQGWRSVSVLFPPYGSVLCAQDSAPLFLKDVAGQVLAKWPRPAGDGLFDA